MSERPTFADRINAELEKLGQDPLTPAQARALEDAHGHSMLPQSEHGGLHPELRARITAAKTVLGDFRRSEREFIAGDETPVPDYQGWALRFDSELSALVDYIERHSS